jgi:hypothetical protein
MVVPYGPNWTISQLKKRLEPSENDRVLEVGPSSRNSDYFRHRGPKWAELGHHEEVGARPGRGRVDGISHTNMKTVACWSRGPVGLCMGGVLPLYE